MREDLRRRLRDLGVVKGVRELATLPSRPSRAIEELVSGHFHTTSHGQCFVAEDFYPLDHLHGHLPLSAFLELAPEIIAEVGRDDALTGVDLRKSCFIDTETTGLSGGAGTMAFVVGLGFFAKSVEGSDEGFQLHQYFLRDPGDEPAMVEALLDQLPTFDAFISFNGQAFDLPILENRFILARTPPPTTNTPHFDLLHPARRLWRYGLSSCALTSLEREVLGVQRDQADVPGGMIPYLYRDYLRTGDAREMKRVLYHNAVDILSMVTLAARLCRTYERGQQVGFVVNSAERLNGAEGYGLGRWYSAEERTDDAERAYRAALQADLPLDLRTRTLRELALLLKRADRRDEALAYWQQLALHSSAQADQIRAHVEMAKYFEWHVEDLAQAAAWTQAALKHVERWPTSMRRDDELADLRHRLARLERKLERRGRNPYPP